MASNQISKPPMPHRAEPVNMHVAHLTSVHARDDTRIFLKQCRSLAANGYRVSLIVADGKGDERRDGVHILDVGRSAGRLGRMTGAARRVFRRAAELDADICHLHDPELLPFGLLLKRRGAAVVFDAHEDLAKQIMDKPYLHPWSRAAVSAAVGSFERFACARLDAVVTATPAIRRRFQGQGIKAVDINNFPLPGELETPTDWRRKAREVCYVGSIAVSRGIREIVRACALSRSGVRLNLGGRFVDRELEAELKRSPGWRSVNELGYLDRGGVREVLGRSIAGLVTLHPTSAYLNSLPVKMFEYMSAGLPVIASDFPLWREIVEGSNCGLLVDPHDPAAIADAIDCLAENPALAEEMGARGRAAVATRYNWAAEEAKLLALYASLRPDRRP
jgi:glycosyltransferase involved in cell wall biosynthesis